MSNGPSAEERMIAALETERRGYVVREQHDRVKQVDKQISVYRRAAEKRAAALRAEVGEAEPAPASEPPQDRRTPPQVTAEAVEGEETAETEEPKRRGRPPGSKNKPKDEE